MAPKPKFTVYKLRAKEPFDAVYNLNLADNIPPYVNSRFLFIYSTQNETGAPELLRTGVVDRLTKGLRSFLEQQPDRDVLSFPQLLGKIHQEPSNGRLAVKITKTSSIPFIVAERDDISFQKLKPEQGFPSRYLDPKIFCSGIELIAKTDRSGGSQAFTVQITFINGGYVLAVVKHHSLLDDTALGHLVRWWFARARAFESQVDPVQLQIEGEGRALVVHDQSSLIQFNEVPLRDHAEWRIFPNAPPYLYGFQLPPPNAVSVAKQMFIKHPPCVNSIFYFSPSALGQLMATVSSQTRHRISLSEAMYALIWRCISRSRLGAIKAKHHPEATMLSVVLDGRRRLDPPLSKEYIGNASFYSPVQMAIGTLMGSGGIGLGEVSAAIREASRTNTSNSYLRSLLQLFANQTKATSMVNSFKVFGGNDVLLLNWERTFGVLDDLELGYGEFQTLRQPGDSPFDGMAMIMPSFGQRDGFGLEVSIDLNKAHMAALKMDFEWKHYAESMEW